MPSSTTLRTVESVEAHRARHTDDEFIELAREGDRGAWDRLYHLHYDAVLGRVRALCGELVLAEELTQDTFFQAMVKIDKFDGRASFRAWLRSVALNIVRNHWRAQQSKARAQAGLAVVYSAAADRADTTPESALLRRRRSDALYTALGELSDTLREVFILHDIEGLDRAEVAAELGITPNNVSVRCLRARERLQQELRTAGWITGEEEGESGAGGT